MHFDLSSLCSLTTTGGDGLSSMFDRSCATSAFDRICGLPSLCLTRSAMVRVFMLGWGPMTTTRLIRIRLPARHSKVLLQQGGFGQKRRTEVVRRER
jgi:hypothetical protein